MENPYNDTFSFDRESLDQFIGGFAHGSIHVRERIRNPQTYRGLIETLEHIDGELRIKMVDDGQPDRRRYQVTDYSECRWLNSSTLVIDSPGFGPSSKRIVLTMPMEKQ